MITEKAYKLLYKYAKKFAKRPQDIDDIVQESIELFLRNPVRGILPKRFFFTLVKRGSYRFYFNTNNGALLNRDFLLKDFNEISLRIPEEYDLENVYFLKEARQKLSQLKYTKNSNHKKYNLYPKEHELLQRILADEDLNYKDRSHFHNLKKKISGLF